ncbi:GRAM domain-containing protein 2A-like isoform X2 [Strigops habroptila]|uniref:GRAM domain-containing protein 2A-like isoform X2 n=1 Tax=Strigops habroptila TaxID=2489341 RepID=UPI0011CFBB24|nr:GRAM domain-containing protein 2A-like isoform X2 [Strigops habroptila]
MVAIHVHPFAPPRALPPSPGQVIARHLPANLLRAALAPPVSACGAGAGRERLWKEREWSGTGRTERGRAAGPASTLVHQGGAGVGQPPRAVVAGSGIPPWGGIGAGVTRWASLSWSWQGLSPVPTSPRHRVRTPRRGSDWSFMPAKLRRSRRGTLEAKRWQSLEERGSPRPRCPVLTRSQTCDPSFCKQTEPGAVGRGEQGPPSPPGPAPQVPKGAAGYHKAFGELAARETLLFCSSCAWHRDVPYHGRLYISSNHLCFHASLLRKDVKAVVPIASILSLKKTNMALLVPNALSIHTATGEKFLFMLLRRREATYRLLKSLCTHLQDNDWSPLASLSNEESLKEPLTSSQSDLEQSTLEPNSLRALPDGLSSTPRQSEEEEDDEEAAALVLSSSEGEPFAKPHSPWGGPHSTLWAWNTTTQLSPLTTIIIIYLLLVVALLLSSGYIALRTLELEQQLAAAAAWPGLNLSQQYRTR